ncbi:MAG TPA: c-type cytochrome [Euzebyales bacterium]
MSAQSRTGPSRPPTASPRRERRARALIGWAAVLAVAGVFVLWHPAQGQQSPESQLPSGPDLYQANCASCHGNQGEGTFRGPTLIGVGAASADYWLRSGRMPLEEPDQEAERGEPAFDDAEIRELVGYVARLGEGPEIPELELSDVDLARGGELYRLNCASCHNWDGKGGALVNRGNAPPLHPVPDVQLAEAVRIGPGAMPQFSERQLDEEELNDVVAYAEYLRTPQDAGGYGLAHWGPSTETIAGFVAMLVLVAVTAWLGERGRG